jgi:hypothetical protein
MKNSLLEKLNDPDNLSIEDFLDDNDSFTEVKNPKLYNKLYQL